MLWITFNLSNISWRLSYIAIDEMAIDEMSSCHCNPINFAWNISFETNVYNIDKNKIEFFIKFQATCSLYQNVKSHVP